MKIKHKAGSKTDREKYAREIILLIRSGTTLTNEHILGLKNLPPGLQEQSAHEIGFLTDFLHTPNFRAVR